MAYNLEVASKKCKRCGVTKPVTDFYTAKRMKDGLFSNCKVCTLEQNKLYVQANKGKVAKTKHIYYKKNRNKFIAIIGKWYEDHKDYISEWGKQYRDKNSEDIKQWLSEYRKDHRDEAIAYAKKYRKTEKGKAVGRKNWHKRRALKLGSICEDFEPIEIFERDNYICQLCGVKTNPNSPNPNDPLYPNLDHIVPLSLEGQHARVNTQCLCHKCNGEKYNTGTGDQLRLF